MVKNIKSEKFTKSLYCVLFSLVVFNVAVFFSREPVRNVIYDEVRNQMLTVDYFGWATYCTLEPLHIIDIYRSVREGWIDNDAW
jgi:hypothetical protein